MVRPLRTLAHCCLLALCLATLAACGGALGRAAKEPWPLAEGGASLQSVLPNQDMREVAQRVLWSKAPWKLKGTDPADGDSLIEGLPNELGEAGPIAAILGARPWANARKTIDRGSGFVVTYRLSDVTPAGYTRVEALVSGYDEEGFQTTFQFVTIIRDADRVPVLAAMTSITCDGTHL